MNPPTLKLKIYKSKAKKHGQTTSIEIKLEIMKKLS